jgi:hypothetical protein
MTGECVGARRCPSRLYGCDLEATILDPGRYPVRTCGCRGFHEMVHLAFTEAR